jgi:hypothetical protein
VPQQPGVRSGEVAVAVGGPYAVAEARPLGGEDPAHVTGHPLDVPAAGGRDAEQNQRGDAVGVPLGVRQAQGRAPGSAEDEPLLDVKVPAQELDVREQVVGRVGRQVDGRITGVRRTPAAAALVEQHDAVGIWIEVGQPARRGTRTRAAVEDDRGRAARVAAGLPVHPVPVADVEQAAVVRFGLRVRAGRHAEAVLGWHGTAPYVANRAVVDIAPSLQ